MEKPFLTGKSIYPPYDPTVGGPLAQMARVLPNAMFNFTGRLEIYPDDGNLPFLSGWRVIDTPGHTPGHVSLWREDDRVLLAGDALCTADMDSIVGITTQKQQFARGGSPFTPDWDASKTSVAKLADLEPSLVAAGHGQPISGADVPQKMRDFERTFQAPAQGRYVSEAARFDENGVTYLPPEPRDDFTKNAAKIGGAVALLTLGAKVLKRLK
jgi:glyoxylase-like metal-dependent hydrolase (beta-lactamase superfamily II)